MRYQPFDWYQTPRYYDIVLEEGSDEQARFVQDAFEQHARLQPRRARRLLEPACGTGRLLQRMAGRGWHCHGFDLSEGMLAMARRRCPDARLSRQTMQHFRERGRFELAFNLVSTFKHLLDEDDARAHLRRIADVLLPGGVYLLGLHLTDYACQRRRRERWIGRRAGTEVICNTQTWPAERAARRERARARLIVHRRGVERRYESSWWFRCYDRAELRQLLASEARLEHVATYGFDHDIDSLQTIDDEHLDKLLVLRRVP